MANNISKTNDEQVSPSFWHQLSGDSPRLFLYKKVLVFLVAFLVFANGIPNDFNVDDGYYTTDENPLTNKGLTAIAEIFTKPTFHDNNNNSFDYRPIPVLSFALQHEFLGTGPVVGHFVNVLLYAFICLLVFVLLCRWFGAANGHLALLATLLYAVHPLHTEVVDSIKNRDELLATIFYLLCALSVWKWRTSGKLYFIFLSIVVFMLGLLCKTTIAAYVVIIPIALYFFSDTSLKKIAIILGVFILSFFVVAGIAQLIPQQTRVFLPFENPMYTSKLPLEVLTATASYILGWYAYLHVLPYPLSFYYGYKYVRFLQWNSVMAILPLFLYFFLGYLVVKNIRKKSIVAFGALVYLIGIVPFSNLFAPAPGMMAERYTFMSSLGYCILITSFFYYLFRLVPGYAVTNGKVKFMHITFLLVFISYAAMSMVRNTQWQNRWTLYSHDIKHLQRSAKANMFYAEQVSFRIRHCRDECFKASGPDQQVYRDSIKQYEEEEKGAYLSALSVAPYYDYALNCLAVVYINQDSCGKAKEYLLQARQLSPYDYNIRSNLAIAFRCMKMIDSAVNEFKAAIALNPRYATVYGELSMLYISKNDTAAAIDNLRSGILNIPDVSMLYMQIARVYFYKKDTLQGIQYAEAGAERPDPDVELLSFLRDYWHGKSNISKEGYYQKKIQNRRQN